MHAPPRTSWRSAQLVKLETGRIHSWAYSSGDIFLRNVSLSFNVTTGVKTSGTELMAKRRCCEGAHKQNEQEDLLF
jgi:hypothetical protein